MKHKIFIISLLVLGIIFSTTLTNVAQATEVSTSTSTSSTSSPHVYQIIQPVTDFMFNIPTEFTLHAQPATSSHGSSTAPRVTGLITYDHQAFVGLEYYSGNMWMPLTSGFFGSDLGLDSLNDIRLRARFCVQGDLYANVKLKNILDNSTIADQDLLFRIYSPNNGTTTCSGMNGGGMGTTTGTSTNPGGGMGTGTSTATSTNPGGGAATTTSATTTTSTSTPPSGGGGGTSSGGGGGSFSGGGGGASGGGNIIGYSTGGGFNNGIGQVLGAFTSNMCQPLLNDYMNVKSQNNPVEVKKLQSYLNNYENMQLVENEIFDQMTFQAVEKYQLKYKNQILTPWVMAGKHLSEQIATGYVYLTTRKHINERVCKDYMESISYIDLDKNIYNTIVD